MSWTSRPASHHLSALVVPLRSKLIRSSDFLLALIDAFFQNVCELDLVFNFYKVYAILDEVFLAGEIEETSKNVVLDRLDYLEKLE